VVTAALFGRAVHVMVEDAAAAIASVPGVLAGQSLTCESLEEVPPSLEDVFVGLVLREEGVADA
jgi:ABC-2 type transport system ATP-binding protein